MINSTTSEETNQENDRESDSNLDGHAAPGRPKNAPQRVPGQDIDRDKVQHSNGEEHDTKRDAAPDGERSARDSAGSSTARVGSFTASRPKRF